MAALTVPKLYTGVIEDVINNVREAFLDEGVDEQILVELKQTWEKKLAESKAMEHKKPETVRASTFQHQLASQSASHTMVAQVPSSAIAHQLTLPPGSLVQPIIRYSTTSGSGVETVTLTMPQKVTLAVPGQNSQHGVQTVMSAPAASAALALSPHVAATLLQQAALRQAGVLSTPQTQTGTSQQGADIQFQTLSTSTLDKQAQYTVNVSHAPSTTILNPDRIPQVDGVHDTSDEEEEEDDFQDNDNDERDDNEEERNENDNECAAEEEDVSLIIP
ncbi:transcription initiation factor IIA subunit 1-like isoform X2 [Limulus polyphemus]|uniref:Transcription initiation factor IIA subunit 1-like isoform X2 n=1 Tax=Limulus polyphemus TaxID=6850 RepID=A0ABM1SCP2_LIMPO|nr:transcription initiation factor IIA subunit 1-like isoform X2 [Limulus polyphemus]